MQKNASFVMFLTCLSIFFSSLHGCGPSQKKAAEQDAKKKVDEVKAASEEPTVPRPGEQMERFDVNKDKKPDMWKFFVQKADPKNPSKKLRSLVRTEIDLNQDGRIDVQYFYKGGAKTRERFDLDYDGKFDSVNHYNSGFIVKQEVFQRSKTKFPDIVKHFEVVEAKGKKRIRLVRKERDQNLDGKPDYWEYWENGMLDRIGRDTDFDGKVDMWERANSSK